MCNIYIYIYTHIYRERDESDRIYVKKGKQNKKKRYIFGVSYYIVLLFI